MTRTSPAGWGLALRLRVDDEVPVADRLVPHGEPEDAVEDEPPAAGGAAVEAEHELVEVALQVRLVDRALVGAEQPSLGERGDPVHAGQQPGRVVAAQAGGALAAAVARVTELSMPL